jgi:anti-sigma B factor antagonist
MAFSPRVERRKDVTVIYCPDRIVAGATDELRSAAEAAIQNSGRVVLDLQSVQYIDSSGLGLLAYLSVSARKRAGDVKLAAPSGHVKEVLEITMIGRMLNIHPTVDGAVLAFPPVPKAE